MLLLYYNDYSVSSGDSCLSYIAIMFWTTTGVAVNDRTALSFRLNWKRSELHFSKFQRVAPGLPAIPLHTVTVPRCVVAGVVVVAVQVGGITVVVPPATFVVHCTRAEWRRVVVLVPSAELLPKMFSYQWIAFKQQTEHWHVSQKSSIVSVYSCWPNLTWNSKLYMQFIFC